jgi:hypothetical protein
VAFPLDDLIERYKHMESTDARDKVYGLLGLVQYDELEKLGLSADYSKSPLEIYDRLLQASYYHSGWEFPRVTQFSILLQDTMRLSHLGHRLELKLVEISNEEESRKERRREEYLAGIEIRKHEEQKERVKRRRERIGETEERIRESEERIREIEERMRERQK